MARLTVFAGVLLSGVVALLLSRSAARELLRAFTAPLGEPTLARRDASYAALPAAVGPAGAEGLELRALRAAEGADGGGDKATSTHKGDALTGSEAYAGSPRERVEGLRRPDFLLRIDEEVDRQVLLLTRAERPRAALVAAARRLGRYRPEIDRAVRAWKVPDALAAIVLVESASNPAWEDSAGGGAGLWGLRPDVARGYGLTLSERYDDRRAPGMASEVATHYLADLRERFGSWELAVLGYGLGYGPTARLLETRPATDYWQLASDGALPNTASVYVSRVLAVMLVLGNLERLGLDVGKADDPIATSDLEVPSGTPLAMVARAAGTSLATIHELNPEYLTDSVPTADFAMAVHVPSAGLARAREGLTALLYAPNAGGLGRGDSTFDWGHAERPGAARGDGGRAAAETPPQDARRAGPSSAGGFHRVLEGETLAGLAQKLGIDAALLASDNALDPDAPLRPGSLLNVRAADVSPTPLPPAPVSSSLSPPRGAQPKVGAGRRAPQNH